MNTPDMALGVSTHDAHKPSATEELLLWLLQYPLLSVEDLAAALGYSAAQCYRSLAELRRHGSVEAVTVPALGISRARLYHLTSEGVRLIAEHEGVDPITLARCFRANEPHLLALLMRAPALVAVQTLIRGMVTQAPVALASAHRPCRVTWAWVRDYRLTAVTQEQADHPLSLTLDAYLILQVSPADGAAPRQGSQQTGHLSPQPAAAALMTEIAGHILPVGSRQQVGWYGVLVLHDASLLPERLMARRLRTLLMCREAPERWAHSSAYAAFPPLLVLTSDAHHAQRWRRVVRSVAAAAGLDPLRGGALVMTAQSLAAPWRAGWYAFDGGTAVRLADLLIPSTAEALPPVPMFPRDPTGDTGKQGSPAIEQASHPGMHPTGQRPMLHSIIGNYNRRAAKQTGRRCACVGRESTHRGTSMHEQLVLASLRLGTRHLDMLRLLHEHPLLSRAELAAALTVDEASAARYLSHLRRDGWVSAITARPDTLGWSASIAAQFSHPSCLQGDSAQKRARGSHEEQRELKVRDRFLVSDDGLRLLAAGSRLRPRTLSCVETPLHRRSASRQTKSIVRDNELAGIYQGCFAGGNLLPLFARPQLRTLLRYPAHTTGVYMFFAALIRAAEDRRLYGDAQELLWWETDAACIRRYRYHGYWRNFRPDGAGEYRVGGAGGRHIAFWLEWDRGTMGLLELRAKFTAYAQYVASREWLRDGVHALPRLLVATSDCAQQARVIEAFASTLSTVHALAIFVTTSAHILSSGPLSDIWRPWLRSSERDSRLGQACQALS